MTWVWSEVVSLYSWQIMILPRKTKHMQHSRAPGPLPDFRISGILKFVPASPLAGIRDVRIRKHVPDDVIFRQIMLGGRDFKPLPQCC